MAKKEKPTLTFPDGTVVEVVRNEGDPYCVHRPLGNSKKDWIVTRVDDFSVVLRTRLKGDAQSACKCLCWLGDTIGLDETNRLVRMLQDSISY